jgi:dTDP-4-dehydrorhamnose reductase
VLTTWGDNAEGCIPFDLSALPQDSSHALELIRTHDVRSIYCAGGATNVEACEDNVESTFRINCYGPEVLARLAAEANIRFVYFSTEYVFDGTAGPYCESSPAIPISVYGRSKYEGEQRVIEAHPGALIVRTTVVYGPDPNGKNFVYSLRRALLAQRAFRVPEDQISTPTYNKDLAEAVVRLMRANVQGIVHVCGPDCISRLEFANRVAQVMGLDAAGVLGVATANLNQRAPRPLRAGLLIDRLNALLPGFEMRNVESAMQDWKTTTGFAEMT